MYRKRDEKKKEERKKQESATRSPPSRAEKYPHTFVFLEILFGQVVSLQGLLETLSSFGNVGYPSSAPAETR